MPNLRVISDNAIERATLSASSTLGSFAASNLQAGRKSDTWRSAVGTTARLNAAWPTLEPIQAAALACCNLSPTATMRVRATNEPSTQNLLLYSEILDAYTWSCHWGTAVNVTPNDATYTAPDGTTSMDKITATAGASGQGTSVNLTAGVTYTFSCWVVSPVNGFSVGFGTSPTAMPGTVNSYGAVGTPTRYSKTFTPGASGTYWVGLAHTAANQSFWLWGAQLEVGAVATSYYPTTSSPGLRPLGYIDSWQTYTYDSGAQLACRAPAAKLRGFTAAQAAGAYAFGGGTDACVWLPASVNAYGIAVDISDPGNLPGYIESSFLVAGPYWESATNFDYGASAQPVDSSTSSINDAGDLISDPGTMSRKVSIPMSKLSLADQETLWNIFVSCGTRYPVFVSMFPGSTNFALERRHQLLGKFAELPAMVLPFFNIGSATLAVQSV